MGGPYIIDPVSYHTNRTHRAIADRVAAEHNLELRFVNLMVVYRDTVIVQAFLLDDKGHYVSRDGEDRLAMAEPFALTLGEEV